MSYNLVDPTTGDLTQVAGRGRAEYGASTIRKGTISFENISTAQWATASVVFDTPMPDADYEIILDALDGYVIDGMTSPLTISNKTINGFSVKIYVHVLTSFRIGYTAFKLYSDVEYSNIVNSMPSDASASNKLVAHQTPYNSFTLNNNSGSQKWYKLGNYDSGHYPARLDFVSARVDGQMFESSIRISGDGNDNNYVSWVGEKGCEISTISVKVDSSRNIYAKMNSYSAVEIRVYGTFTLNITELNSEPSGTDITLQKLVTESDFNYKSGTVNFNCGPNQWTTVDVTFDSPMPDSEYTVTLESSNTAYVHVQNVTTKTTNGFIIIIWNRDELAGDRQGIINWQAYKIPH